MTDHAHLTLLRQIDPPAYHKLSYVKPALLINELEIFAQLIILVVGAWGLGFGLDKLCSVLLQDIIFLFYATPVLKLVIDFRK